MQEIWTAGIKWDDVLSDNLMTKWEKWVSKLPHLTNLCHSSLFTTTRPFETLLHAFLVASKDAYT